jgi:hypothetical protein
VDAPDPALHPLDGIDITPRLTGAVSNLPDRAVYTFYPKYNHFNSSNEVWNTTWRNVIYDGDYKLIEMAEYDQYELYNLAVDGVESNNLFSTEPVKWWDLVTKLHDWYDAVGAPPYELNPSYDGPSFAWDSFPLDPREQVDTDGDRWGDNKERVAGTDTNDANSILKLHSVTLDSTDATVNWSSVSGKTYAVEYSTDLENWQVFPGTSNIAAVGTEAAVTGSNVTDNAGFFRVRVNP